MTDKQELSSTDIYVHYILRVAAFLCFVGHGAFGFITKEGWVKFFSLVHIPREIGFELMPVIGTVDVLVGFSVLLFPTRFALAYMVFWSFMTAMLRPAVGMGFCEFFERAGNYGVPFALLYISAPSLLSPGWFKKLGPLRLDGRAFSSSVAILQITTASLLIGHGVIGFIHNKESLALHFSAAPLLPEMFNLSHLMVGAGFIEIVLGLLILIRPFVWATVFAFIWKVFTEALFPLSGDYFWEFVERSGSYGAPLALTLLLLTKSGWKITDFWHCQLVMSLSANMTASKSREVVYASVLVLALMYLTGVRSMQKIQVTADAPLEIVQANKVELIAGEDLLTRLRQGGLVFFVRHFNTPGKGLLDDKRQFEHATLTLEDFKDCSWQRGLTEFGRKRAAYVGEQIRSAGIPIGEVHSSPYCRCIESAKIGFAKEPILHKKLIFRKKEFTRERMETFTDEFLKTLAPKDNTNTVIIGHRPAMDIFGRISEGEVYVFEPEGDDAYNLIAKIAPDEWASLTSAPYFLGRNALHKKSKKKNKVLF